MKKIITLLLICVLSLSFSACGKKSGETAESIDVTIANFDEYAPSFAMIRLGKGFGRITRNTNPNYAISGSSAKLQPTGDYSTATMPYMVIPTKSFLYEYDYSDFTKMTSITFDIYNAQSEDKNLYVGLVMDDAGDVRDAPTLYTLKNGWNTATFILEPSIISLSKNITDIRGIYLQFDNTHIRVDSLDDFDEVPVFYLDNVVFHMTTKDVVLNKPVLDKNEICNFEKIYQTRLITADANNQSALPDFSVVVGQKYGVDASSGFRSLRFVTKPSIGTGYAWINFPEKYMNSVGAENLDDNDQIAFDIYNANDTAQLFFTEFYIVGGDYRQCVKENFTVPSHSWYTYKISVGKLNTATAEVEVAKNMGRFALCWREYDGDNREFFFDNFRIIEN